MRSEPIATFTIGGTSRLNDIPADSFVLKLGQFFPVFHVSSATLLLDLAAIAAVGIAASLVPTWRAARVNVVEGFRHLG